MIRIGPSGALRLKSTLPQIGTPTAKLSGRLLVRFGEPLEDHTAEHSDIFKGSGEENEAENDDEARGEGDARMREIMIAPLGCSRDGSPVPSYTPLGFLQPALE